MKKVSKIKIQKPHLQRRSALLRDARAQLLLGRLAAREVLVERRERRAVLVARRGLGLAALGHALELVARRRDVGVRRRDLRLALLIERRGADFCFVFGFWEGRQGRKERWADGRGSGGHMAGQTHIRQD